MVWSFVYLALRRLLELMALCWRSTDANEVEILVLGHQPAILRRQHPRPRLQPKDRALLATQNPRSGDQRIRGELLRLGGQVSAGSIARVLRANGLQPAPRPASTTRRSFLRRQAAGILACDFLAVDTVFLQRL